MQVPPTQGGSAPLQDDKESILSSMKSKTVLYIFIYSWAGNHALAPIEGQGKGKTRSPEFSDLMNVVLYECPEGCFPLHNNIF